MVLTVAKYFGEVLKELRKKRNMTLRDVELATGISNPYLSQIERGERGIPTVKFLRRLADVYHVSVNKLIEVGTREMNNKSVNLKQVDQDTVFVSKGFEKLSKKSKSVLKSFLSYLLEEERSIRNKKQHYITIDDSEHNT
jgi:transcriptional regulator with XRE-family HTH domain